MRLAMLKLAGFLVTYGAFALFQAVAQGHPWHDRLARFGRYARALARVAAFGGVGVGCMLLGPAVGWTEAALFTSVELVLVASLFVLLAPVAPRLTWGLAIASPVLAGAIAIGMRWMT